ncbi:Polyisoprenyl-teichoic acid--peptidoglycan teichoic acid transferase TagU [Leucobacter aridicollis]|uniref:LCP family protein n=1 Tax=Leucobacter aridicollis TaxID=283878 RepID=UPI000EAFF8F6|nr:LytR family transcriptional attenuator [Mycolicibacterium mucogenicum 261Sha1.1M5]
MARRTQPEQPRRSVVRHGRLSRSSSVKNFSRFLLTTLLVVAFSGVATAAYAVWGFVNSAKTVDLGGPSEAIGAGKQSIDGELTILLAGSDTRAGQGYDDGEEGELNDVNLLLHVSADHKNATVVSFPRDLMVPIPSCPSEDGEEDFYPAMSEQQLNTAMGYGGLPCVARTISELTGMDIPYAAMITFDGVVGISEAVGGVEVCLTEPLVDPKTDLDLPAGMNTLEGWDALQFLRTRYGVGDGSDISRINNQQVFMSSLMRKLKSAETLSDPFKVWNLAKAAVDNMLLSESMKSMQFMQAAAGTVRDIDLGNINFVQYPTVDHPYQSGRLLPNSELAAVLMETLQSGAAFDVTGTGGAVATPDDATTETPETPATDAPATETPATPEGEAPATDGSTPTEGGDRVQLPPEITGLKPDVETCSVGRTNY